MNFASHWLIRQIRTNLMPFGSETNFSTRPHRGPAALSGAPCRPGRRHPARPAPRPCRFGHGERRAAALRPARPSSPMTHVSPDQLRTESTLYTAEAGQHPEGKRRHAGTMGVADVCAWRPLVVQSPVRCYARPRSIVGAVSGSSRSAEPWMEEAQWCSTPCSRPGTSSSGAGSRRGANRGCVDDGG